MLHYVIYANEAIKGEKMEDSCLVKIGNAKTAAFKARQENFIISFYIFKKVEQKSGAFITTL